MSSRSLQLCHSTLADIYYRREVIERFLVLECYHKLAYKYPDVTQKYALNFKEFVINNEMSLSTINCHCIEYINGERTNIPFRVI